MSKIVPDPQHFDPKLLVYMAMVMAEKLKMLAEEDVFKTTIPRGVFHDAVKFCKEVISACGAGVNGPYEASLYIFVSNVLTATLGHEHTENEIEEFREAASFLISLDAVDPALMWNKQDRRKTALMAKFFAGMAEAIQELNEEVDEDDD